MFLSRCIGSKHTYTGHRIQYISTVCGWWYNRNDWGELFFVNTKYHSINREIMREKKTFEINNVLWKISCDKYVASSSIFLCAIHANSQSGTALLRANDNDWWVFLMRWKKNTVANVFFSILESQWIMALLHHQEIWEIGILRKKWFKPKSKKLMYGPVIIIIKRRIFFSIFKSTIFSWKIQFNTMRYLLVVFVRFSFGFFVQNWILWEFYTKYKKKYSNSTQYTN